MRAYLILTSIVLVVFANSLQNSFAWDDISLIVDNPKINLPLKDMPSIFTTPLWEVGDWFNYKQIYYRPIVSALFVLNYKIWGMNPAGFHLTNIMLHLIAVIILYKTGLLLFKNDKLVSLIAASIFAVHPAATNEPIGRTASGEVIFGFFIILSLYLFLKEKKYLSLFAFSLALFSKETAVMLPFALAVFAIRKNGLKKGGLEITPYIFLVGIYLIIRALSVETVLGEKLIEQPLFTRILTMAVAILDYLRLLFIPYPLSPFYPAKWHTSIFEPKVLAAIMVLLLICFFAFKIGREPAMLFLFLFPFIMLAPVIWRVNTFPVGQEFVYIAERFLYVPTMLFSLFVSQCFINPAGKNLKKYMVIICILIISMCGLATANSNTIWKNDISLFQKIIRDAPDAAFAHACLGSAYDRQNRLDDAIKEYLIAIKLKPNYSRAHNNLGVAYAGQGKIDAAINEYLTALKANANDPTVYYNLGNAYLKQGKSGEAIQQYAYALKLKPGLAEVHNNLGNVYYAQGRFEEAANEYLAALKSKTDYTAARINLGLVYSQQGQLDKAIEQYLTALKSAPDNAIIHNNLGKVYSEQGRLDEAVDKYQTALKLKPDYVQARSNLGNTYYEQGRLDEAINEYLAALKINSEFPLAHFNLGMAYMRKGLKDEARNEFESALKIKPDFIQARKILKSLGK